VRPTEPDAGDPQPDRSKPGVKNPGGRPPRPIPDKNTEGPAGDSSRAEGEALRPANEGKGRPAKEMAPEPENDEKGKKKKSGN